MIALLPVSHRRFAASQAQAIALMPEQHAWSITPASELDPAEYVYFTDTWEDMGFAWDGCEIKCLYKRKTLRQHSAVKVALATIRDMYPDDWGCGPIRLHCFDWLEHHYQSHGFKRIAADPWKQSLAPARWPEVLGKPSYVSMTYNFAHGMAAAA